MPLIQTESPMGIERVAYQIVEGSNERTIALPSDARLLLRTDENGWVEFWCCVLDTIDSAGMVLYRVLFNGEGSHPLGELRHLWWSHDEEIDMRGYVYYPPLDVISSAMAELAKVFA